MKAINKIWVLAALLPFVLFSCKKAELTYEPGEPDLANCYGVYFPTQEASGSHTFDPEMDRIITVTVARKADQPLINEEIKVPYTVKSSEENIFQIGEIVFASGQSETTIDITFDKAEEGVKYDLSLQLEDPQYASLYASNPTELKLDVMVVAWQYILNPQTKEKAVFTFTQEYWNETCWAYVKYYDLDGVWTCQTESFKHYYDGKYYGPEDGGYGFWGNAAAEGEGELQFKIYTKELNPDGNMYMELIPSVIYHHSSYDADVIMFDYYYFWTVYQDSLDNHQSALENLTWIQFAKNYSANYPLGYYDNNGGLFFYVRTRGMYGIGGWTMESYDIIGIGEGFVRTDFSLSLETDYPVDGASPIYVTAGRDVKTLQYAIYPGKLTENEAGKKAEAIISKEEASESFSEFAYDEAKDINYATMKLSPETTGQYTVVAVAMDEKGTAQNNAYITFNHISAEDVEKYAVDVTVFTEPVPARYGDTFNEYNSFAFGISGTDLTEVHVAIAPSSKVTDATWSSLKADASTAVNETILAQINALGGFYTAQGSLDAGTEYTVLVWATNGNEDKFVSATWETTPSPEVWEHYGTATWTDSFLGTWFSNDPVTYDVELERSVDDPTRFRLVNVYGEAFPYNDPGDWDDTKDYYLVINTADPDYTWFETFDTGCNWGYGNFILTTQVGRNVANGYTVEQIKAANIPAAKYADNKITFTYRAILKAMANYNNGGWYYGNNNADTPYVIVFNPGATLGAATAAVPASTTSVVAATKFADTEVSMTPIERDAQPVKVSVSVSYDRKEKVGKDMSKAPEAAMVSFK